MYQFYPGSLWLQPKLIIYVLLLAFLPTRQANAQTQAKRNVRPSRDAKVAEAPQVISLSLYNVTLEQALQQVATAFDVGLFIRPEQLPDKKIQQELHSATLLESLDLLLKDTSLQGIISAQGNIIIGEQDTAIVEKSVQGKVTDAQTGQPLPGINILVRDTNQGTITDIDGNYQLVVPNGATLVFSFVGYKTETIAVGNQTTINIQLQTDVTALDEVVVTALGLEKQAKQLSYSQQSVDVETLNESRSPNVINSLSGKVAGVQIVPSGFNTGSARIVIRGNSSITGNNQPLFVVDGIPIDNTPGDEQGSLDYGNNAADINPEDVESIEVLKGPNAAALYGSRAANGVVLITTKSGSSDFKVSLASTTMFQTLTEFPEYQNAYGVGTSFYIDNRHRIPLAQQNYRSWGSPMMGQPYIALDGEEKPYLPQPDNVKNFYQTARLLTNSVAVEGGSKNSIFRLSYTNYDGTSVVEGFNENSKHTIDLRMQNDFSDWLSLDTKVNYIRNIVDNRQYSNSNGRNPTNMYNHMARSTQLSELIPYKDEMTGQEIGTHRNFSNPYWVVNENPNHDEKDRIIAFFNPEIKILPSLRFIGRLGADMYWWEGYEFNNIGSVIADNPNGYLRTFNTWQQNLNVEGLLSYEKTFGDFSLSALAGANMYDSKFENRQQSLNSLLQPGLINLSNAREFPNVSQNIRRKRINSLYGSVTLGYRNYAFLDVTGRNDWSSTLPAGNNSYFYPSVGGTLVVSDMLEMESDVVSNAKIRASYAVVGNDTDPYRLTQTYAFTGFFDGAPLAAPITTKNNPILKPERTASFEYGINVGLFNNRLGIDLTQYNAVTTNQIITAQLPTSSGYQRRLYNAGKVKNWGYEASVNGMIVNRKKFSWESSFNFSANNSLVVELLDSISRFQLNRTSRLYVYAEVGKPYAYLRGLGAKRDEQGRMLLQEGGGRLEPDNDMAFGSATPDWLAGWSNTVRWGNFDLSFLIDAKMGGLLYSQSMSRMLVNGVHAETMKGRDDYYLHKVIWGEDGDELSGGAIWDAYYEDGSKNERYMSPQSYEYTRPNYSEFVVYDASFVKLRELVIGYNMPANLLDRTPFERVRISLTGRNLGILYRNTPLGIDPEATSTSGNGQGIEDAALPPYALYGFNINLSF